MQNFSPQSTNRVFVAVTLLLSFPYVVEIHSSTISTIFVITWQLIDCKMGVFSTLFHTSPHSPFMAFSWHFVAFGYRQALRRCSGPSGFPLPVAGVASVAFCSARSVHSGYSEQNAYQVRFGSLHPLQFILPVSYASILLPCSFLFRCRAFLARFSLRQGNYSGCSINGPKKGIRQPFLYRQALTYKQDSSKGPFLIPSVVVGIWLEECAMEGMSRQKAGNCVTGYEFIPILLVGNRLSV